MAEYKKYKKIASGANTAGRSRLYLADDHLLHVEGSYVENYRRFYFRDIQAISAHKRQPIAWLVVLAILLLITLISGSLSDPGWFFFSIPTVLVLLYLLYRTVQGGFCHFRIVTEVQDVQLCSVKTMSKANKVAGIIEENIRMLAPAPDNGERSNF